MFKFILDAMKVINPFYERIPVEGQEAYFDDFVKYMVKMNLALDHYETNKQNCRFSAPYKIIVAYARKCS